MILEGQEPHLHIIPISLYSRLKGMEHGHLTVFGNTFSLTTHLEKVLLLH